MKQNQQISEIILVLLKYKKLHVREISKITSIPLSNTSRIMKCLIEQNVVDFKSEGKNKIFSIKNTLSALQFVKIAEHYKFLTLLEMFPFFSSLLESVLSKSNSELVIIFGSYARLDPKIGSDIDIYISTRDKTIKKQIEMIHSKLSVKNGDFNPENLLVQEIIKNHIIVRGVDSFYEKNKFSY